MVERLANPFRPGFNQTPVELAGRDDVLEDVIESLETAALDRRTPRPLMLTGPRGVGKTVLLADAADRAREGYDWPRVHVELKPRRSFTAELADEVRRLTATLAGTPADRGWRVSGAQLRAQLPGLGAQVDLERATPGAPAAAADLRGALAHLAASLIERGGGFVLTVDEAQLADRDEMVDLAAAAQHGTGANWPMVMLLAGLPAMRDPEHSATYFERGRWHELGVLSPDATLRALTEPARIAGRPLEPDAAELLAEASGGYPFAIQLHGHYAWRASAGRPTINRQAAEAALPRASNDLTHSLYASRWNTASPEQRRYLTAVAALLAQGSAPTGGEVAAHLGQTTPQLSRARAELLTAGHLTALDGRLRFTTPGMADYVRARTTCESSTPDHGETPGRNPHSR